MNKNTKKVVAMSLIGVAGIGLGGVAGAMLFPVENQVEVNTLVPFPVEKIVEVEKIVNQTIEVPVEVPVEVEKIVNVTVEDETFKQMACDRLMYKDLIDCVKEVKAEDEAMNLAKEFIINEFRNEIAYELDKANIVDDYRDVELVKIFDKFEDVDILYSSFRYKEYEFKYELRINDDGNRKNVFVTLNIDNGDVKVVEVEE